MSKLLVYNMSGEKVGEKNLTDFDVKQNANLYAQAVLRQLANRRSPIASTKNRGEVSGGGRKPFKQKGTGNARAGSTRSPLWIGGGVTFGPTNKKNYAKDMPAKMIRQAIKMVINDKLIAKKVILLDKFELDKISTKQVYEIFSKLPIDEGSILVIISELNANIELSLSNIPYAKVIKAENLNVIDLTKHDYLIITAPALEKVSKIFKGDEQKVTSKAAK